MTKSAVSVSGLTHRYDPTSTAPPTLNDLSLTLTAGETLALVGASGSGKSTLLNVIGGLEPVQSGAVSVFDNDLCNANEALKTQLRRQVLGFVYQAFNLIPTLSVADNIRLPLALSGVNRREQDERIDAILSAVDLQPRRNAHPDALSGGEQQRVALARAVVHNPPLLLADEPTGNLDATTGQQVMSILQNLVSEQNTTLLMVTHSQTVASFADRVLVMQDGQLVTPETTASTQTTW